MIFSRRLARAPSQSLDDLLDVSAAAPDVGEGVFWDGNSWRHARLRPTTPEWNDMVIGIERLVGGSQAPNPEFLDPPDNILRVLAFRKNRTETVRFVDEIRHDWQEGTELRPHIHVSKTSGNGGGIRVRMEAKILPVGGPLGLLISDEKTINPPTGIGHTVFSFAPIPMIGCHIGTIFGIKFSRIHNHIEDQYADSMALLSLGIHNLSDSWGSTQEFVK